MPNDTQIATGSGGNDGSVQAAADLLAARMTPRQPERQAATPAREPAPAPDAGGDDDTAPADDRPSGGTAETDDGDPQEPAPIARPASWSKDDDDDWQALPRAAQERIAKRERDRDVEVRRRQNAIEEQRAAYEAEQATIKSERERYAQNLTMQMTELERQFAAKGYDKLTPNELAALGQNDPAKAADYAAHFAAIQRMRSDRAELQQKQQRDYLAHITMEQGKAHKRLAEKYPDTWGNEKFAKTIYQEIGEYLTGETYGYPVERIQLMHEPQQLEIVWKAMQFDRLQEAKAKAEKAAKTATQPQRVLRPGVATRGDRGADGIASADATLRKAGTVDAAAAAIAARVKAAGRQDRLRVR